MMVFEQITGMLAGTIDVALSPIAVFHPVIALIILSIMTTTIVMGLGRLFINRKLVKEIKTRMEEIRENLTKAQKEGNKEEINKFFNEWMKTNGEHMKQMIKVYIISAAVIMLFLPWLNFKYGANAVAALPFNIPVIGSSLTWIFWYALVSITVGWVTRKLLGLDYV